MNQLPPPTGPPRGPVHQMPARSDGDVLRAILATLQVIACILGLLLLMLAAWLSGVFVEIAPRVEPVLR